jgi:hypothetical protein
MTLPNPNAIKNLNEEETIESYVNACWWDHELRIDDYIYDRVRFVIYDDDPLDGLMCTVSGKIEKQLKGKIFLSGRWRDGYLYNLSMPFTKRGYNKIKKRLVEKGINFPNK